MVTATQKLQYALGLKKRVGIGEKFLEEVTVGMALSRCGKISGPDNQKDGVQIRGGERSTEPLSCPVLFEYCMKLLFHMCVLVHLRLGNL